jgi:hypothetical protein
MNPGAGQPNPHAPRLNVRPAEDGAFELFGVPAGDYLLVASVPKMVDGKQTPLMTYYPGTSEQASAVPVTVGDATQHDGFDFVVRME